MPLTLRDIPRFPDYVPGQTDHQFMQAARAQGPLARDRYGIVTAFSQAHMELFSDDRWTRQIELEGMRAAGVDEGPMFDFVRNAVLFANGRIHRNRCAPAVRARRMIAPLRGAGPVDFVDAVAGPLPAQVIAAIIGAPEADTETFATHVYSAIRGLAFCGAEERAASDTDMAHLDRYAADLIADRRAAPQADFLTAYLDRTRDGPLSEDEVRTQLIGLVVAGSDTTRGALAATVSQLLLHPEQWRMLIEAPDTHAAAAVSEGLRFDPVIGSLARITTEPREIEGVLIPPGTLVAASMLTALRDPAVYARPDRFDITRRDHPPLHPVFGSGPHRCLGEALARIEMEEALKALAHTLPDLRLDGPPARLRGYGAVRNLESMRVLA